MTAARSILVVDDDVLLARTIADILDFKGFPVEVAHSGEEALARIGRHEFGCVLMDIRMPGLNGVETRRRIRRLAPDLPVILMTAYTDEELIAEGRTLGVQAILAKPLDLELMLSIITRCVEPATAPAGGTAS